MDELLKKYKFVAKIKSLEELSKSKNLIHRNLGFYNEKDGSWIVKKMFGLTVATNNIKEPFFYDGWYIEEWMIDKSTIRTQPLLEVEE